MTLDVSTFLKGVQDRETRTVLLAPDPGAVATAAEVASAASAGGSLADAPDPEQVAAAGDAARASAWAFTVGPVGRAVWQQLIDQHPPTEQQSEQAAAEGARLQWDPVRFPVAAIAATLREARNPDGDTVTFDPARLDREGDVECDPDAVDLAQAVWDGFGVGDTAKLWQAVLEVNIVAPSTNRLASFGDGSPRTRTGGR